MKLVLLLLSLTIVASQVLSSPPHPSPPPTTNATEEEVLEVTGDPGDATVLYELDDDPSKTTVSERRALDLTPPMGENGASVDGAIVKRFGSEYFINEDLNVSTLLPTSSPGVIQKVSRKSPSSEEERVYMQDREMDLVSGQEPEVLNPNTSGVNWLLNLYNPHHWNPASLPGAQKISDGCKRDVGTYLRALRNGTIWAAESKSFLN